MFKHVVDIFFDKIVRHRQLSRNCRWIRHSRQDWQCIIFFIFAPTTKELRSENFKRNWYVRNWREDDVEDDKLCWKWFRRFVVNDWQNEIWHCMNWHRVWTKTNIEWWWCNEIFDANVESVMFKRLNKTFFKTASDFRFQDQWKCFWWSDRHTFLTLNSKMYWIVARNDSETQFNWSRRKDLENEFFDFNL